MRCRRGGLEAGWPSGGWLTSSSRIPDWLCAAHLGTSAACGARLNSLRRGAGATHPLLPQPAWCGSDTCCCHNYSPDWRRLHAAVPAGVRRGAGAAPPALLQLHPRRQRRDLQRAHQHRHGGELGGGSKKKQSEAVTLVQHVRIPAWAATPAWRTVVPLSPIRGHPTPSSACHQHPGCTSHCCSLVFHQGSHSALSFSLPSTPGLPPPPRRWPCPTAA